MRSNSTAGILKISRSILCSISTAVFAGNLLCFAAPAVSQQVEIGSADVREGYELPTFVTQSRSLLKREGERADLLSLLLSPPLGLPKVPVPEDNPVTQEKIDLGRKLFYDRRLSRNGTMSCAMCHIPEQGFTSNEMATPIGVEGRTVRRNAPTIYNVAYFSHIFDDGRESSLEFQIWGPLLALNEMANISVGSAISRILALPDYQGLFESAFGERGLGIETLGMAIASYERTLISANSPFDRYLFGKEEDALGEAAKRGVILFTGKGRCSSCHLIGQQHALFTDDDFHNTGIGWAATGEGEPDSYSVQVAPGVVFRLSKDRVDSVGEPLQQDMGRYEVTLDPDDRWLYKTPSLRNVALTAPYMHNGRFGTLRQVVEFYNRGGIKNPGLDPRITPLELSEEEVDDIVAFLESLTGDNIELLIKDGLSAGTGETENILILK